MGTMHRFLDGGDLILSDIPHELRLDDFTRTKAAHPDSVFISGEATPKAALFAGGAALSQQIVKAWEDGDDSTVREILAYERDLKN